MYAIPPGVSEECLLDRWASPSNNDLLMSALINAGVSGSLQSYYEFVHDSDLTACGWGPLLHRKRLSELLVEKRTLGNIITTCLPQEDEDRYYSS